MDTVKDVMTKGRRGSRGSGHVPDSRDDLNVHPSLFCYPPYCFRPLPLQKTARAMQDQRTIHHLPLRLSELEHNFSNEILLGDYKN